MLLLCMGLFLGCPKSERTLPPTPGGEEGYPGGEELQKELEQEQEAAEKAEAAEKQEGAEKEAEKAAEEGGAKEEGQEKPAEG